MFLQDFALQLKLVIGSTAVEIPSGQIKHFSAHLRPYGFEASVDFWVSPMFFETDTLYPLFTTHDAISASLVIDSYYNPTDPAPVPVTLVGVVCKKSVEEITIPTVENVPMLYRHYFISFQDVASVLWKQHFPCELFVGKTMKNVIEAHKGDKITISYKWGVLDVQHPILFLGLGDSKNEASFYDFLTGYVHCENGVFSYNSQENSYKITESKEDLGEAQTIEKRHVSRCEAQFPQIVRHSVHVLNSYTESTKNQAIENSQVLGAIRKDILTRTSISSEVDGRVTLETAKLKIREHLVKLTLCKWPMIALQPGYLISLAGGEWGKNHFTFGKTYRIIEMSVEGTSEKKGEVEGQTETLGGYQTELTVKMELQSDTYVSFPPFKAPHYPVYVEGKIVSEQGKDTEETYQIYTQNTTSLDMYKVSVPLWSNQQVIVPFSPRYFPAHFYFPAFKNSRVLLAFDFKSAVIDSFLAWREGARLPMEGQGNHLLLGLTQTSKTSLNHVYEDQKPVFNIFRKSEKDTQTIQIKEGCMILETKEES